LKKTNSSGTMIFNTDQFDTTCSDWLKDAKKRYDNEMLKRKRDEEKARKRTRDELENNTSDDENILQISDS